MNCGFLRLASSVVVLCALSYGPAFAMTKYDGNCMDAPLLAIPDDRTVVRVSSTFSLQQAISRLKDNMVVLIAPGEYQLHNTLWINGIDNIIIRGDSNRCDDVVLIGKGMENPAGVDTVPHGIWTNSSNTRIQNLTIRDMYHHAIIIDGQADAPHIYNVRMLDIGKQFVKANPLRFGNGADDGKIEYSVMKYVNGPANTDNGGGIGYTNGVDVHAGKNWLISNSRFENFHTPDSAQFLWNPAILMWNGASDTRVENNTFVNVDRAIALGLIDRSNDHSRGLVLNNMIYMRSGLYSSYRREGSDAAILVWSSPCTQVLHNTVITQGNTNRSIELRFDSSGATVRNNLVSSPISHRGENAFDQSGNVQTSDISIFTNLDSGDLHLRRAVPSITNAVTTLDSAPMDIDGDERRPGALSDAGADEITNTGM